MSDSHPQHPPKPANEPAPESGRSCLWRLMVFGAWACLAVAVLLMGGRMYLHSRLDAATKAKLAKLDNEIITLPAEWQTAAKVPPREVIEFHQRLSMDLEKISAKYPDMTEYSSSPFGFVSGPTSDTISQKLRSHDQLTTGEQKSVDDFLLEFQPIIERTSAAVKMEGFSPDVSSYITGNHSLKPVFRVGAGIMAMQLAKDGKCTAAMEVALFPLYFLNHQSGTPVSAYLDWTIMNEVSNSAEVLNSILAHCDDVSALHRGLDLLNSVRKTAYPEHIDLMAVADYIHPLVHAKATGFPVDLSPQPLTGYFDQWLNLHTESYNQWVLDNLPAEDPRHEKAEKKLRQLRSRTREKFLPELLNSLLSKRVFREVVRLVVGYSPAAFSNVNAFENVSYYQVQAKVATAQYELVRLRIAQRLAELETGARTPVGPDAIKPYIDTIPDDPFSTGTARALRFSPAHNQFYSLGPDEDDDAMKSQYDSSNGTISNGDIFIKL